VSQLIRSPFLSGGEVEMSSRARLDARIRRYAEPVMTLDRLVALVQQAGGQASCPVLIQGLSSFVAFRQTALPGSETHTVFAKLFPKLLQIVGFPGERSLDSTEYQTVKKWHEVIAGFVTLDSVLPEIRYADAVRRLRHIAGETLFQPQTPDVPIQILGVLEAAGMTFDHLWVMGLTDEQWPLRPRPNPFLPLALQQQAKLPLGSTQESLAYSRQLTNGWLSGAKEVILSYSQYSDDRDGHPLEPSPLIQSIVEDSLTLPVYMRHLDLIIQAGTLEWIEDDQAVPLNKGIVKGGTAVIRDYAACPFRAWAKHQMNAMQLDVPHVGLNAMERGILVHDVLAQVWGQLKTRETLEAISDGELEEVLAKAVNRAIQEMRLERPDALSGRFACIEQRRLMRLVREWLATEKKREHFTVIATEDKREIHVGELIFRARLDRIDELAHGKRIIIDYKTKKLSVNAMLGERPDEPQLPLYLVMTDVDAIGIAFASVKLGQMEFSAIVRDPDLLPGIKEFSEFSGSKQYNSWDALIAAWQHDLTNLAQGFSRGDAKVNPKNYPATCEFCTMQPFCRVHERVNGDLVEQDDANE
ncbi:MAG: PD-(D/E)XK nuclease family protein, partial [Pseudomonadota bacterium]